MAVDRGLGGVVVTAFDASGAARGSATSKSDGTYTLASTGTGPYRIEFATASFPTNFTVGPIGPGNGSNVQFFPDGGNATVNLGLFIGTDYLKDNPTLVAGRLVFGDPAGANAATPALVTFPYNAGANGATNTDYDNPTATTLVTVDKVGSIYGLAQNPETNTLYASAYTKKLRPSRVLAAVATGSASPSRFSAAREHPEMSAANTPSAIRERGTLLVMAITTLGTVTCAGAVPWACARTPSAAAAVRGCLNGLHGPCPVKEQLPFGRARAPR